MEQIEDYWNDKHASPDTSENFDMKIKKLNKKDNENRIIKEKLKKNNTKTIINIPKANFIKKNVSIPKPSTGGIGEIGKKNDDNKKYLLNDNLCTDIEDEGNERIPLENNNKGITTFKSVNFNNNNLGELNLRNIRLNTEDNTFINNQNIYTKLLKPDFKSINSIYYY